MTDVIHASLFSGIGGFDLAAEIIINKLGNYKLLSQALEEAEILRAKAKA